VQDEDIHVVRKMVTKSSAIAERPARRSVSVEMLFYCYANDADRSPVSLRSTFSNCHVLFRYLHSFVHASFNYRTASIGYQHTSSKRKVRFQQTSERVCTDCRGRVPDCGAGNWKIRRP